MTLLPKTWIQVSILGSGTTLPKTDPGESDIYSHARAVSVFPDSLNSLPSLQKLKHLRALDLEGCEGLQAPPSGTPMRFICTEVLELASNMDK